MSDYIEGNAHTMRAAERRSWGAQWPDFAPSELASWGGVFKLSRRALDGLQKVRTEYGKPMAINSAYRTPEHNKAVGGAKRSQHVAGTAFDIPIKTQEQGDKIEALARKYGAKGIGRYNTFIHIDWRDKDRVAKWDMRSERLFVGG